MSYTDLSEQEIFRRNSMDELRKMGIEPYPAAMYHVNANTKEILEQFNTKKNNSFIFVFNCYFNFAIN